MARFRPLIRFPESSFRGAKVDASSARVRCECECECVRETIRGIREMLVCRVSTFLFVSSFTSLVFRHAITEYMCNRVRITFSLPSASVAVAAAAASCRRRPPLLAAVAAAAAAVGVVGAAVVAAAAAVPPTWSCSRLRAWRHCPRRPSRCRDCRCGCAGRGGAAAGGDRGPGIDTRHALWN